METIKIKQGASWSAIVTALQANGNPVNLTGFTAACQIRSSASSTTVANTVVTIITDAVNGKIKLLLTPTQTLALPTDGKTANDVVNYVFDIYIYDSVGGAMRIVEGIAQVSPGTTRM